MPSLDFEKKSRVPENGLPISPLVACQTPFPKPYQLLSRLVSVTGLVKNPIPAE
jgi:hypothetical protein